MSSIISKNIAHLRKKAGWTQQELASKLGIPRSTLSGYEQAYAEPPIEGILTFSKIFSVDLEALLKHKLWEGEYSSTKSEQLKVLAISVDNENKSNIELVEAKAEAGYTGSFDDPSYIKQLPRLYLPQLKEGTYRAFEIRGDSMLPLNQGDIVVCSFVEKLSDIKDGMTCVVVTQAEGIVYKRIINNTKKKVLLLQSDNEIYQAYELPYSEVAEIWKYEAHLSFEEPGSAFKSMEDARLLKIANDVSEIKSVIGGRV